MIVVLISANGASRANFDNLTEFGFSKKGGHIWLGRICRLPSRKHANWHTWKMSPVTLASRKTSTTPALTDVDLTRAGLVVPCARSGTRERKIALAKVKGSRPRWSLSVVLLHKGQRDRGVSGLRHRTGKAFRGVPGADSPPERICCATSRCPGAQGQRL